VTVDARDQEIAYLRGMLKEAAGTIERLRARLAELTRARAAAAVQPCTEKGG